MNCVVGLISIKRYILEPFGIGIEDYPDYWEEILRDQDPDGLAHLREYIPIWLREGNFVLHWDDARWYNGNGVLVAS